MPGLYSPTWRLNILREAICLIAEGPVSPEEKNYSEDYGRGFRDCLKICQRIGQSALKVIRENDEKPTAPKPIEPENVTN